MEPFDVRSFFGGVAKELAWQKLNESFPSAANAVSALDCCTRIADYLGKNFPPEYGKDVATTVVILLDELKEWRKHDIQVSEQSFYSSNSQPRPPQQPWMQQQPFPQSQQTNSSSAESDMSQYSQSQQEAPQPQQEPDQHACHDQNGCLNNPLNRFVHKCHDPYCRS